MHVLHPGRGVAAYCDQVPTTGRPWFAIGFPNSRAATAASAFMPAVPRREIRGTILRISPEAPLQPQ